MEIDRRFLELQAQLCQVLASAKRLEILYTLKDGELTAGELAQRLGTTAPNLSQHLAAMRKFGLVEARKEGVNTYYRLALPEVLDACSAVRRVLEAHFDRFRSVVQPGKEE